MGTNLGDLLKQAGLEASAESAATERAPTVGHTEEARSFAPKVVVRKTRKGRGGKTVTLIQGVTGDRDGIAKQIKRSLGCGARVEEEEIVVQGDQVDRVARWLVNEGVRNVVKG